MDKIINKKMEEKISICKSAMGGLSDYKRIYDERDLIWPIFGQLL